MTDRRSDFRILIVGAGVGGMTLAALLERQGLRPTLVERAPSFDHAGYMLGLWPLGYRVLHGLGLYPRFADETIAGRHYEIRDDRGELVKRWSLDSITDRFGPNLSCTRPQLIRLLHSSLDGVELRLGTALEQLEPLGDVVAAHFSDGSSGAFDLVVGADGAHSRVRELVFGTQPTFDTGWGGWVWWADVDSVPAETFLEHWGAGRFVGAYPTAAGAGIFAGTPVEDDIERSGPGRRQRLRMRFSGMGDAVDRWLDAVPDDDQEMFFWRMADVRSAEWARGRVVLLGDAAAAFLPTAGIGASMAMESAAVLADELSRVDRRSVELALDLYVQRRRRRVERTQDDSRHLARAMFVRSATLAHVRDIVTRFYSVEGLAGSIASAFGEPI